MMPLWDKQSKQQQPLFIFKPQHQLKELSVTTNDFG
jgi:hypothetical protein